MWRGRIPHEYGKAFTFLIVTVAYMYVLDIHVTLVLPMSTVTDVNLLMALNA